MNERLLFALIFAAIALPIAFILDRKAWRKKSIEELESMICSGDWKQMPNALKELGKRGVDLSPYLTTVFEMMVSDSKMSRSAGKIALKDSYRNVYDLLPPYDPIGDIEVCKRAVLPVMEKVTDKK
jgi:hypothetical protein